MRTMVALVVLGAGQAASAQPTVADGATCSPEPGRSHWVEVFGEHFPTQDQQQSVYTGVRLLFRVADQARLVLDGGYVAAGREAGDGDDGLAVGIGLEQILSSTGDWRPFVRFKLDHVVDQRSDLPTGTLDANAAMMSLGYRLRDALDLHLDAGRSYSGDLALGFGVAFGLRL